MIVKLLSEHHLECLSLKGGCRGSSESTHVKYHIAGNPMHWLNYPLLLLFLFIALGRKSVPRTYLKRGSSYKGIFLIM